jgi:hypothetical protein
MKKPAEYRRNAEECRKMATGNISDSDRAQVLGMAETWSNMATAREELLAAAGRDGNTKKSDSPVAG